MTTWLEQEAERPYHPVAALFPVLEGPEFEELKADVAANGLLEAIWLHPDGSIIDGRNRHRACIETETQPTFRTWDSGGSLLTFVVSMNLHRRHLSYDQRVGIALKLEPAFAEEAAKRQAATQFQNGEPPVAANSQQPIRAAVKAAKQADVGSRAVYEMKAIQNEEPDLADRLIAGETTVRDERKSHKENRPHVTHNSGNNEWYTPPEYIEAARQVMGDIDLDPASSEIANKTVHAATFYTQEDDGLLYDWTGRVWCNPPYASHLIGLFANKLAEHVKRGDVSEACVLVNNATETAWFNALLDLASCVCFIRGRVKFIDMDGKASGAPLQGQAVLYIGPNAEAFGKAFSDFGRTLYARRDPE